MELILAVLLIFAVITLIKVLSLGHQINEVRSEQISIKGLLRKLQSKIEIKSAGEPAEKSRPAPKESFEKGKEARDQSPTPSPEKPARTPVAPPLPPAITSARQVEQAIHPARKMASPPSAPSKAAGILGKIWEWILVGDQYRKKGVSVEFAVATTWLIRLGVIGVVACAAYFLMWSIEQGLLGPTGRVGFCILGGITLLVWGYRLFGKQYDLLGQGFFGGGLAVLYYSMYAAGPQFDLIPVGAAFVFMMLITVTAGLLAMRVNSMLVAILGIIGGFSTPIMLSTGEPNFAVLYAYLFLLGAGILVLSHFKSWHLLNYLGCFFTWFLVLTSLGMYYENEYFPVAVGWISLLFVLHASIAYWHNTVRNTRITVLEIIYLVANTMVYSLTVYFLIRSTYGRPWPAVLTLLLAIFFVTHVFLFLGLKRRDRTLLITLIALAGLYTTLTMPLVLERETLTMSWALLAVMFLWLSWKVKSPFLRTLSYLVYLLVFGKLSLDMHENFADLRGTATDTFGGYLGSMADRLWTFGICIASVFSAFFIERKRARREAADRETRLAAGGESENLVMTGFYWIAIACLFIYMQLEVNEMFKHFMLWRLPVLTVLWCGMGAFFLIRFNSTDEWKNLAAASFFLGFGLLKIFLCDISSWKVSGYGIYMTPYEPFYVMARLLDFGTVLLTIIFAWRLLRRKTEEKSLTALYGYGGLLLLFVYTTLELNAFLFWKLPSFRFIGISLLWVFYAVAYVAGGLWKDLRGLRITGLLLFAVVAGKVVFLDLGDRPVIYKVIVCLVVGVAMLIGGFAYLKTAPKSVEQEDRS